MEYLLHIGVDTVKLDGEGFEVFVQDGQKVSRGDRIKMCIRDSSQADAKGVEYECIVDPTLDDYYMGDAMKLQQVLLNILSNAIKFTSEGGKVTFSAEQRKISKVGATLRFVVNDTGVGMSEDFLQHIFEPF